MKKNIFFSFFALLLFQVVLAQKQDKLVYAMMNNGEVAASEKTADYILVILPADSSSGQKLYPVQGYYPSGKHSFNAVSHTNEYDRLIFEGPYISYYPNGHRKSIANYVKGAILGDVASYYPNGQIYTIKKYKETQTMFVECRDSTGKIMTENGNGNWIEFDKNMKDIFEKGAVKDSLKDGKWELYVDTQKYVEVYQQGKLISSTAPNDVAEGNKTFVVVEKEPSYKNGGENGFIKFVEQNKIYPAQDKKNKVQGKVVVKFVVEKDGSLTNIKIVRAPDQAMADEAIRVIGLSPKWSPGMQGGRPVRVEFIIPVNFYLDD